MTLEFRQGGTAYDITVSRGSLSQAGSLFNLRRKVLVVTGEGVPPQYAQTVLSQCPEAWLLTIPEGESNKTLSSVELILSALLEHGFTRSDAVVAVGGGVIGDTAGFAAACYMRGIDWYNVPTTLLSQADSSVGGKTGVNLHGVKNIVGAFHQPSGVLIDPDTLDTLSPRLFSEGLAEIIKMAATSDAALFNLLETTPDLRPIMEQVLTSALSIKIHVVAEDPTEKNLRAVLNFGHTVGHAIEASCSATRELPPLTSASLHPSHASVGPSRSHGHGRPWSLEAIPASATQSADNNSEEAFCGAEAGVVSGDRGRPWPREWEGPAGIRGTDGSLLSDGQRIPVGGMRTEGPKSSGNNSSEVEQKAFYHGEAVAVGMLYMSEGEANRRIGKLLKKYNLPTTDPFTAEQLMAFAAHDKKRRGGTIKLVRVSEIGSFRFQEATQEDLRTIIQARKK